MQIFGPVGVKKMFAEIRYEVIKSVGVFIDTKFIVFDPTVNAGVMKAI